ncbi:MAG: hypothetical protein FJ363_10940 [Gemmatimonadetes bacterium]|nr:hypothetical protein [Gemmatimonadota bacterium]
MRNALMYHGGFERNFSRLAPGFSAFEGTDGNSHALPAWPSSADGLRFGYMEKHGKKFCVVRVLFGSDDITLKNEMVIDPGRHTGFGHRLGPEPTLVEDDVVALTLLEDVIKKNAEAADALLNIRMQFKLAAGIK